MRPKILHCTLRLLLQGYHFSPSQSYIVLMVDLRLARMLVVNLILTLLLAIPSSILNRASSFRLMITTMPVVLKVEEASSIRFW